MVGDLVGKCWEPLNIGEGMFGKEDVKGSKEHAGSQDIGVPFKLSWDSLESWLEAKGPISPQLLGFLSDFSSSSE